MCVCACVRARVTRRLDRDRRDRATLSEIIIVVVGSPPTISADDAGDKGTIPRSSARLGTEEQFRDGVSISASKTRRRETAVNRSVFAGKSVEQSSSLGDRRVREPVLKGMPPVLLISRRGQKRSRAVLDSQTGTMTVYPRGHRAPLFFVAA